ncbi:MAG: DUF2804 family protein [Candidatus Thorarchaeota archaeon]
MFNHLVWAVFLDKFPLQREKAHKLNKVTFHMDVNDYMKPWSFTSNDGRFEIGESWFCI